MTDPVEAHFSWGYQQFVYAPSGAKVAVMNGQTLDHAYVRLPGGSEAIFSSSGLSQYRQADWLGSARLGADTTGAAVQASAYAPDGEAYQTWGGGLSFTGQNQDTVWNGTAALYDFPARRYSPTQGRWISPDPAGLAAVNPNDPQTWNRYAYVRNAPLAAVDPSGLILCESKDGTLWNADSDKACSNHGGSVFALGQQITVSGGAGNGMSDVQMWWFQENSAFASTRGTAAGGGATATQDTLVQRLRCGSLWAQNHSLAAAFGAQNTTIGRALGGNLFASGTITALVLMDPSAPVPMAAYGGILGGAVVRRSAFIGFANAATGANAQLTNLPLSASGTLLSQGAESATAEALASAAGLASGVGDLKFAYDAATFAIGFYRGCHQ